VDHERLAEGHDTLFGTRDGALEHQEVVLDDTVVREASHRGDRLLGDVRVGRGITLVAGGTNTVDLFVELGTVVVTICERLN
jgi:hypothetical protein